jgi:hypothetical protein
MIATFIQNSIHFLLDDIPTIKISNLSVIISHKRELIDRINGEGFLSGMDQERSRKGRGFLWMIAAKGGGFSVP